jgi:hypothetical protein
LLRILLGLIAGLAAAAPAQAAPVAYEYGGVITSADPSSGVTTGTRFTGTFTYDPATDPMPVMIEGNTSYYFGQPINGATDTSRLTLSVGGNPVFDQGGIGMGVLDTVNYHYTDPFTPSTSVGLMANDSAIRVSLGLTNPTRSVDPTLAIPTSLSLTDFPVAKFQVNSLKPGALLLYSGTIDTLTPLNTPEPSTLALSALVGLGLAIRRQRRARA